MEKYFYMTGYVEDFNSQIDMMQKAYRDLQKHNPEHKLLKIATLNENDEWFLSNAFWEKYPEESYPNQIYVYSEYTLELQAATGRFPI